jgi:hypothetical protein
MSEAITHAGTGGGAKARASKKSGKVRFPAVGARVCGVRKRAQPVGAPALQSYFAISRFDL